MDLQNSPKWDKARYHSDPVFRAKHLEALRRYRRKNLKRLRQLEADRMLRPATVIQKQEYQRAWHWRRSKMACSICKREGTPASFWPGSTCCKECCLKERLAQENEERHAEYEEFAKWIEPLLAVILSTYRKKDSAGQAKRDQSVRRLRLEMITAYGGACRCCGNSQILKLTLEHKNGGGGAHRRAVGGSIGVWRLLKRQGWPKEDYEILCSSCNIAKRYDQPCPDEVERAICA